MKAPGEIPSATPYRDEALARLAAAPPDAGYHGAGRRRWRERVGRLARCLDELHAGGADGSGLGSLLGLGFRALLPLADPGWWRAHPKARLNAEARRQLRGIDKARRRVARRGGRETALGRLGLQACAAAAIYARHRDVAALDLCIQLLDFLNPALGGPGGAGRRRPQKSAGARGCDPAINHRRRPSRGQPPRRRERPCRRSRERR